MLTKCAHFSSLPETRTLPCFLFLFVHQSLLHGLLPLTLSVAACSGIFSCSGNLMRKISLKIKRCLYAAPLPRWAPSLIQGTVTCSRFQRAWDKTAMLSASQDSPLLLATSRVSPVSLPVTSAFCLATLSRSLSLSLSFLLHL